MMQLWETCPPAVWVNCTDDGLGKCHPPRSDCNTDGGGLAKFLLLVGNNDTSGGFVKCLLLVCSDYTGRDLLKCLPDRLKS